MTLKTLKDLGRDVYGCNSGEVCRYCEKELTELKIRHFQKCKVFQERI